MTGRKGTTHNWGKYTPPFALYFSSGGMGACSWLSEQTLQFNELPGRQLLISAGVVVLGPVKDSSRVVFSDLILVEWAETVI